MHISYDPDKDASNTVKHGVSLSAAAKIEWETAVTVKDMRAEYGENRLVTLAYIGNRLHCMVHVARGNTLRVISLRKANKREEQRYAET